MGTHDDANIAGPQKEFLSGFKCGAGSHGKEKQSPSVPQPGKIGGGIASRKLSSGLQNQTGINPFQPAQQACKNTRTEQQSTEPSEKNDVAGLGRKVERSP